MAKISDFPDIEKEVKRINSDLLLLFDMRDGAPLLIKKLSDTYTPEQISVPYTQEQKSDVGTPQRVWELSGLFYLKQGRFHEALSIFTALYEHMLKAQSEKSNLVHKGMPLVWISECFSGMGFPTLTKRYLMLTLIEDAIREKGSVSPEKTGIYFRLAWRGSLSDAEIKKYARRIFELKEENPIDGFFPEFILQELDQDWMTEIPAPIEAGFYYANNLYVSHLVSNLGDGTGKTLERLSTYLLSCMPGCRTLRRAKSRSTEYDIVCSIDGLEVDFRSELGRYFVCECKDWDKPADFSTMAKFCRVLDSVKSRSGILFSKKGISGEGKTKDAEREQLKVFQDRGMVIVVVDENDIKQVANGKNFINMLKKKYERVRLDLISES